MFCVLTMSIITVMMMIIIIIRSYLHVDAYKNQKGKFYFRFSLNYVTVEGNRHAFILVFCYALFSIIFNFRFKTRKRQNEKFPSRAVSVKLLCSPAALSWKCNLLRLWFVYLMVT